jgi:alpha-1,3/alpha-1,6-mannosyltransferase
VTAAERRPRLRIAFLHPDLGFGGAERLVIDAVLELERRGHDVTLYTTGWDPERTFPETRTLDVRVVGGFLPRSLLGRLRAPAAILRATWGAVRIAIGRRELDVVVCDLVSHVIPVLRALSGAKVLLYGHFPDLLLAPKRRGPWALYRAPLDALEGVATGAAHRVVVNSAFTAGIFRETFRGLGAIEVLHPGVVLPGEASQVPADAAPRLVSFGRFEDSKNLRLAVETLALLRDEPELRRNLRWTIAGGFDERLASSRRTLADLQELATRLGVGNALELRFNLTDEERAELMTRATAIVHTHEREHFGIVPLEAMALARPVVAVAAGGPLETVSDGVTGYLRPADPGAFAAAIAGLLRDRDLARRMGDAGRARVRERFSRERFCDRLEATLYDLVGARA